MTKKHFERIADIVRAQPNSRCAAQIAEAFIALFSELNPRFDRQRFLKACGLEEKDLRP